MSEKKELKEVHSQLIGDYNFNNIMTAVTIGRYFKVPSEKIKKAVEDYIPKNNRSQILKRDSNTFILDAYNANPTSMKNALENFSKTEAETKIAIMGDMLEMGEYSLSEHEDILNYAQSLNFNQVIIVGKEFEEFKEREGISHFENTQKLKKWFDRQGFKNTCFLIKGSRGIGLEKLLT